MAKQAIGVGSSPNDGTGNTLRDGGVKINSNKLVLIRVSFSLSLTQKINSSNSC
jgi:hypothetical protein